MEQILTDMRENKEKPKHIEALHFEHEVWKKRMEFYKIELKFFTERLEEIVSRYTDQEVLKGIEHFQNQFILQRDVLDVFVHDIKMHEQELVDEVNSNPVAVDHRLLEDHPEKRAGYMTFIKLYDELKLEFMDFLSKWM